MVSSATNAAASLPVAVEHKSSEGPRPALMPGGGFPATTASASPPSPLVPPRPVTPLSTSTVVPPFQWTSEQLQAVSDAHAERARTLVTLLANGSAEDALRFVYSAYSELLNWLSQKASSTPESRADIPLGDYGVHHSQTPSQLLFNRDITEVNRTLVGFLALQYILADNYEAFVRAQPADVVLTREGFAWLRDYVKQILPTPDDIDAMAVVILINDIGKIKRYADLMTKACGRLIVDHDEVLWEGAKQWPEVSPSFNRLSARHRHLIVLGLNMGSQLNIGQFAQTECPPGSALGIEALHGSVTAYDFKFVELLLDVAGVKGHVDSRGARAFTQPICDSYRLTYGLLKNVVEGRSTVTQAYNQLMRAKNEQLMRLGFAPLDVSNRVDYALLRLMGIGRANSLEEATLIRDAFASLPANVRAILVCELNAAGIDDSWATLLYYAPGTLHNALTGLQTPQEKHVAIVSSLLAFARVLQDMRCVTQKKTSALRKIGHAGVVTVDMSKLADAALTPSYKEDPNILWTQEMKLVNAGADAPTKYDVVLGGPRAIDAAAFPAADIGDAVGQRVIIVGIGGGSDCMQAAMLGKLLEARDKTVAGIISVRESKTGSRGKSGQLGEERVYPGAKLLSEGVYEIDTTTHGVGRVFEPIIAADFRIMLVLDDGNDASLAQRLLWAHHSLARAVLPPDSVLLVDTGGDALYRAEKTHDAHVTPDQDLHVLRCYVGAMRGQSVQVRSAIVAAGVDTPPYAQEILAQAQAKYCALTDEEKQTVLNQYTAWDLTGKNPERYGKTPFAWQAALRGAAAGYTTIPLPESVVTDWENPWTPFVRVPLPGVFFMDANLHLAAIGAEAPQAILRGWPTAKA